MDEIIFSLERDGFAAYMLIAKANGFVVEQSVNPKGAIATNVFTKQQVVALANSILAWESGHFEVSHNGDRNS